MTKSGASLILFIPPYGYLEGKAPLCAYNLSSHERVICSWPKRESVLKINGVEFMFFGRTAAGKTIGWAPENPKNAEDALRGVSFSQNTVLYHSEDKEDYKRSTIGSIISGGKIVTNDINGPLPDHAGKGLCTISIRGIVSYSGTSEFGTKISGTEELRAGVVKVEIDSSEDPLDKPSAIAKVVPEATVTEYRRVDGSFWYRLSQTTTVVGLEVAIENVDAEGGEEE